jgi:hypothetical protein
MSLDYFLLYKEKCEQIISHIEEIINLYDDLIDESFEHYNSFFAEEKPVDILCETEKLIHEKDIYIQQKNLLINKKTHYVVGLQNACTHDFCEDDIDITPERSQKIIYCIKCEYTKK